MPPVPPTYRAALGEAVRRALEEVGPAPLALHDGAGRAGGLAEGLAGQLHLPVLALGHVDGAQQGLDHVPAARGVAQACGVARGRGGDGMGTGTGTGWGRGRCSARHPLVAPVGAMPLPISIPFVFPLF